jgi:A/G-specific adenine glycosylase
VQKVLWEIADNHTPGERVADYTQAIMDLGATVCTRRNPDCGCCPVNVGCLAFRDDLVHTLPTAKPRKPLPARDRRFWLIQRDDGSCLLERRPPGGLWGGLWSPPERDKDSSIEHLTAEFGLDLRISPTPAPPPFTHAFTHLQMNVIPMRACAGKHTSVADRDDLIWYRPGLNQSIGLSAVASRLLNHLFRSQP